MTFLGDEPFSVMGNSDGFGHFLPNLTWDFPSIVSDLHSEIGMWLPCHFQFDLMLISKDAFQSISKELFSSESTYTLKAPIETIWKADCQEDRVEGAQGGMTFLCCNCIRKYRCRTGFSMLCLTDCISNLLDSPDREGYQK